MFLGTAIPEILIMTLGAAVGTFIKGLGTGTGGFLPLAHQSAIPAWFVTVFLLFCIVQLFAINSLDMYSSGVTLQALGARLKRYQAVVVDCVIALGVTMYAIFSVSFSQYLTDFVDAVIVWIAPWCAIYLVDWAMRKFRYVPWELQRTDSGSLYWRNGGVVWPAIIAQLVGMYAAFSGLSATFNLPRWLNELTDHTGIRRIRRGLQHLLGPRRGRPGVPRAGLAGSSSSRPPSRTPCSRVQVRWLRPDPPRTSGRAQAGRVGRRRARRALPVLHQRAVLRALPEQRNAPSACTSAASSPRLLRHFDPSVTRVPTTTGSAPTRRIKLSAALVDPPVEITSSTTATRRPCTAPRRARSKSNR